MPATTSIQPELAVYTPNEGGQQLFMDDYEHKFLALAGGWYAGKTWAGARKLINLHIHNAINDAGQPTFVKGMCIGQNYGLARQVNIPEIQAACDEIGLSHRFVSDPKRYCFEFPDLGTRDRPSELLVRSGDSPETINGFTVGHGWGDETPRWAQSEDDPKRDALIQAKGRLRDPKAKFQQLMLTFTHEGDGTRVYRDFEEKPLPEHALYRAGTFENPTAAEFAESMTGQLSTDLAAQYLAGNAVNFRGGRVFSAYEHAKYPAGNLCDTLELNPNAPLHLAIDFNIDPGMHGVIGQHDEAKDVAFAYREIHEKRMSGRQLLETFRSWYAKGGIQFPELHVFGDAAGGTFAATGEKGWDVVREWFKANMPDLHVRYRYDRDGSYGVEARVNAMNCALRTVAGTIRYLVDPSCERLIADFRNLKWDGNEIDKRDRKTSHASEADSNRIFKIMPIRRLFAASDPGLVTAI